MTQYCDEKNKCNNSKCQKFKKNSDKIKFHQDFLKDTSFNSTLRFMDWMNTNNSKVKLWSKISKFSDYTWATEKGVPIDVIIELVYISKKDL